MKNFIYKKAKKTNVDIKNVFTINKIAFLLSLIIKILIIVNLVWPKVDCQRQCND